MRRFSSSCIIEISTVRTHTKTGCGLCQGQCAVKHVRAEGRLGQLRAVRAEGRLGQLHAVRAEGRLGQLHAVRAEGRLGQLHAVQAEGRRHDCVRAEGRRHDCVRAIKLVVRNVQIAVECAVGEADGCHVAEE